MENWRFFELRVKCIALFLTVAKRARGMYGFYRSGDYRPYFKRLLGTGVTGASHSVKQRIASGREFKIEVTDLRVRPTKNRRQPRRKRQRMKAVKQKGDIWDILKKFEEFRRLKNEEISCNSESTDVLDSSSNTRRVNIQVRSPESDKSDNPGDSFIGLEMALKELSLKDNERIIEADNTRNIEAADAPIDEPEISSSYGLGMNYQLRKFIQLFLTPEIYKSARVARTTLAFPRDKERPWAYSNENGDLIVDSVSEILAETDLCPMAYEDFLDLAVGQLKRKPMSAAPIIKRLEEQYCTFQMSAVIQFSMNISDKLLESSMDKIFESG
jgi:hypothetical protein